ncbi:MAG TPA: hypothetical protein VGN83_13425 [Falsiroseomonas sp.]|jgi:hypothetical protein|nr:hypothetical protein [Falsiroseomonas sp.]
MTTLAIVLLLATIALGAVVGLLHLQRARRPRLVNAHLALALGGAAAMLALLFTGEGAPSSSGVMPLALITVAIAAGWGAGRAATRSRGLANILLPGHVAAGIAAFFFLLAWAAALTAAARPQLPG